MGKPQRNEGRLFYTGFSVEDRVPADHHLRRVARAIDFGFVRARVARLYGVNGHESVDPTLVLKLLFLAFYEKVRSERELMRQLPLRLDWLWFCGLDLDSDIPDHSVLSKARRRWGLDVFEQIFLHVLEQCVRAGLVEGTTAYADSTVLKADASVESRVPRALWNQLESGLQADEGRGPPRTPPSPPDVQASELPPREAPGKKARKNRFNIRSVSRTDPDAATTRRRGRGVVLGYKDHCLIDGRRGVVTVTVATAADYDDGVLLPTLLEKYEEYLGRRAGRVVGDSAYGTLNNICWALVRGTVPYLKPRPGNRGAGRGTKGSLPAGDRATALRLLKRRLHVAEGRFAEAHVRHDHRRCRWRRRWRVQIQCYLVAAVQNIKKLVRWTSRYAGQASAALLRETLGADQLARDLAGDAAIVARPIG